MPWNGSGIYNRASPSFSGASIWQNERDAGNNINAQHFDYEEQDIATALNNCLCKDGQNVPTAALPMNGFNHTGVGVATGRTQYARADQVQDQLLIWAGATAGTSTAYTAAVSPPIQAYAAGQEFLMQAHVTCGAAPTLAVNGLTALSLKKAGGGTPLAANDIIQNQFVKVTYDSTGGGRFLVQSVAALNSQQWLESVNAAGTGSIQVLQTDGSDNTIIQALSGKIISLMVNTVAQWGANGNAELYPITNGVGSLGTNTNRVNTAFVNTLTTAAVDSGSIASTLTFKIATNAVWAFSAGGHFVPNADNTYDIGTSSIGVRDLYIANSIKNGSIPILAISAQNTVLNAPTGKQIKLQINAADTLQLSSTKLFPTTDASVAFGDSTHRFQKIYVQNVFSDGNFVLSSEGSGTLGLLSNSGNSSFFMDTNFNFGTSGGSDGVNCLFITNATSVPSINVATGGYLYSQTGALKWRGAAGTVTVLAPA